MQIGKSLLEPLISFRALLPKRSERPLRLFAFVLFASFLSACNRGEHPVPTSTEQEVTAGANKASSSEPLSPEQLMLLKSSNCRIVVEAYVKAIRQGDYSFAARFWKVPEVGAEEIQTLFRGYEEPNVHIAEVLDGGADSRECSVVVALSDNSDPARPLRPGKLLFRNAPDPYAEQHWILKSSTFLERMQRSGTGEPA